MYGYHGRTALIDVTSGRISVEPLDEKILRMFIGGSGLASYLLATRIGAGITPMSPDNPLVFAVGPFCGTTVPTSGRHHVVSLSPLTGILAESDVGGHWGFNFQASGYDALVITGASQTPISIVIGNGTISIEDATPIWGMDTFAAEDHFKERYPDSETACIGVAGERLVRIAAIVHEGRHARVAGRCGLGAVMGSKKIKAIVVRPSPGVRKLFYDPEALRKATIAKASELPKNATLLKNFGTLGTIGGAQNLGDLPVKNWQLGSFGESTAKISGQHLAESGRLLKRYYCKQCTIGCGRTVMLSDGLPGAGPEYETAGMYGPNCLIDDIEVIIKTNELANRLGIDTISSGSVIAYLMEAYERGEVGSADLGGIVPGWGNGEALLKLVEFIGNRKEGIGELLGEGVAQLSLRMGNPNYAIHSKGLELPAHDPRAFSSMNLAYATANRGGCHLQGMTYNFEKSIPLPEKGFLTAQDRFSNDRKVLLVVSTQDFMSLIDSLKLCKFSLVGGVRATDAMEWLNSITGWDMNIDEFLVAGERIFNLKRYINTALGVSRKDDVMPVRTSTERKGGGTNDLLPPPLEETKDEYYTMRGWDKDGIPTEETLRRLGVPLVFGYPPELPTTVRHIMDAL